MKTNMTDTQKQFVSVAKDMFGDWVFYIKIAKHLLQYNIY